MKVITYLAFTVLSVFIQFCVMDFIQEKIQIKGPDVFNGTSKKEMLSDLLKNISSKPHALYYRTVKSSLLKNNSLKLYSKLSIPEVPLGTTDGTTTIFDILYDENTSDTEVTSTTTETYFTSTEFENITEMTLFTLKNKTSNVPSHTPKTRFNTHCNCNLLYKVCDINCCCDQDCSDIEHNLFRCGESGKGEKEAFDGCITHIFTDNQRYGSSILDMFCVVKTNLPTKRSINKYHQGSIVQYYKWRSVDHKQSSYEFKKTLYQQGDPIWLLKNGIIYYLDFPAPAINNYCTDRVPITFLKEEKITCSIKFKELEMFNILNTSEEAMVISSTNDTINSTALNCSNLHCIYWTILACDDGLCLNYNKSLNEASCTDIGCTNIALKIDYDFYYSDLRILNATIKLHLQNISNELPFMAQEINIRFHIGNSSIDPVIELSGNPGYISGLPVIVSFVTNNHTENFFNNTSERRPYMLFPENKNGLCMTSNTSTNIVKFGINKRTKCRYVYPQAAVTKNKVCNDIQNNINELLGLKNNITVSPFGNPQDITDDNWINLHIDINKQDPVYGQYHENSLKLYCYNLINRISITFMFANVDEKSIKGQNKIMFGTYELTTKNISFSIEDISTVITIDISFVDLTKPSLIEYAGSPHLNIHLPNDFFFPFPQNKCFHISNTCIVTIYCCVLLLFANKITLE